MQVLKLGTGLCPIRLECVQYMPRGRKMSPKWEMACNHFEARWDLNDLRWGEDHLMMPKSRASKQVWVSKRRFLGYIKFKIIGDIQVE